MFLDKLYESWSTSETLTETEVKRVVQWAIKTENGKVLQNFFHYRQREAHPQVAEMLRTDGSVTALRVWVANTKGEALTEFFTTTPTSSILDILEQSGKSLSEEHALLLWKRNDPMLRLYLISHVKFWHNPPKAWTSWFNRHYPFTGKIFGTNQVHAEYVLGLIGKNCSDTADLIFNTTTDLSVKSHLTLGSDDSWQRGRYVTSLHKAFLAKLETGTMNDTEVGLLLGFVEWLENSGDGESLRTRSAENPARVLLKAAKKQLSGISDENARRLDKLVGYMLGEKAAEPVTRPEVVRALKAGTVPEAAIKMAALELETPKSTLPLSVMTHPALSAAQALSLLRLINGDNYHHNSYEFKKTVRLITEKRDRAWREDLVLRAWRDSRSYQAKRSAKGIVGDVMNVAGETLTLPTRRKLAKEMLDTPSSAKALSDTYFLSSEELFMLLPLEWVSRDEDLQKLALHTARWLLKEDEAAWENFEMLSSEFDGTFGELLHVAAKV